MNKLILTLLIGFLVPVLMPALELPKPVVPKPTDCGGCICIHPGTTVTIPAGRCGMTVPGGDVIHASGGAVTVTTGANGRITGIALAPGAWADVIIFNGPTTISLTGGPGTASFESYGNTINNNSAGANVSVTGTGNTVNHNVTAGTPNYTSTSFSNHLNMNGQLNLTTNGNWTVHP